MLDKGTPCSFAILGDRAHNFAMPRDLTVMPPKVVAAFEKLTAAARAEQKATGHAARLEANSVVRDALGALYDTAASTSKAARQQYDEAFEYAVRRYARALGDAQAALQDVVTSAQLHDQAVNGHAVGLNPEAKTKPVMIARLLADSLEKLPAIPGLEEK
ncbi:hypothetical protein [Streptomyces sp. NPDC002276]